MTNYISSNYIQAIIDGAPLDSETSFCFVWQNADPSAPIYANECFDSDDKLKKPHYAFIVILSNDETAPAVILGRTVARIKTFDPVTRAPIALPVPLPETVPFVARNDLTSKDAQAPTIVEIAKRLLCVEASACHACRHPYDHHTLAYHAFCFPEFQQVAAAIAAFPLDGEALALPSHALIPGYEIPLVGTVVDAFFPVVSRRIAIGNHTGIRHLRFSKIDQSVPPEMHAAMISFEVYYLVAGALDKAIATETPHARYGANVLLTARDIQQIQHSRVHADALFRGALFDAVWDSNSSSFTSSSLPSTVTRFANRNSLAGQAARESLRLKFGQHLASPVAHSVSVVNTASEVVARVDRACSGSICLVLNNPEIRDRIPPCILSLATSCTSPMSHPHYVARQVILHFFLRVTDIEDLNVMETYRENFFGTAIKTNCQEFYRTKKYGIGILQDVVQQMVNDKPCWGCRSMQKMGLCPNSAHCEQLNIRSPIDFYRRASPNPAKRAKK